LRHTGLAGAKRTLLIMTLALIAVAVLLASCAPEGGEKTVEKKVETTVVNGKTMVKKEEKTR
jgi:ABC-type oligopeptide transport system substrate-binding subunit